MRLKFRALEVPNKDALYETNHLGWSIIETLVFNYDGKGTILALKDGELEEMGLEEFRDVLYGGWYEPVNLPESQFTVAELSESQAEYARMGVKDVINLSKSQSIMLYNLLVEKGHPDLSGYAEVKELFRSVLNRK